MRKTIEEMIEVMQAFKDGKKIERRSYDSPISSMWEETADPIWDWDSFDYRIKPENHYIPYDSVDEINKNKWVRRKDTRVDRQIVMVDNGRNQIAVLEINNWLYWLKLIDMFREWEYEDGTPFGKLVQS